MAQSSSQLQNLNLRTAADNLQFNLHEFDKPK